MIIIFAVFGLLCGWVVAGDFGLALLATGSILLTQPFGWWRW
jgi:hypothetical protein